LTLKSIAFVPMTQMRHESIWDDLASPPNP
jgi:hypothetical protein